MTLSNNDKLKNIQHAKIFLFEWYEDKLTRLEENYKKVLKEELVFPDIFYSDYGNYKRFQCINFIGITYQEYGVSSLDSYCIIYKKEPPIFGDNECSKCIFYDYCDIDSERFKEFMKTHGKCKICRGTIHDIYLLYELYNIERSAKEGKLIIKYIMTETPLCCSCFSKQEKIEVLKKYYDKLFDRGARDMEEIKHLLFRRLYKEI